MLHIEYLNRIFKKWADMEIIPSLCHIQAGLWVNEIMNEAFARLRSLQK